MSMQKKSAFMLLVLNIKGYPYPNLHPYIFLIHFASFQFFLIFLQTTFDILLPKINSYYILHLKICAFHCP